MIESENVILTNIDNPRKCPPSMNGLPRGQRTIHNSQERDSIIANSDRFNAERMEDYKRIAQYVEDNDCTFEKALEVVG